MTEDVSLSYDKKIKIKKYKEEGKETSLKSETNREGNKRRLISYNERSDINHNRRISDNPENDGEVK